MLRFVKFEKLLPSSPAAAYIQMSEAKQLRQKKKKTAQRIRRKRKWKTI